MERIREVLSETSLKGDVFPAIENPFDSLPIPTLGPATTAGLPPMANPALVNNAQFGNIDQVSGLTLNQDLILNNPMDRAIARRQNKQKTII